MSTETDSVTTGAEKGSGGIQPGVAHVENYNKASAQGQLATDQFGHSLVEIDPKAEAKLRLKLDFYVLPTVAMLYLFCFIDRANIGNARLAGFEEDLNLTGNDYNTVLTAFYISYTLFELPSNIMCKWMGPGYFLPAITLGFGICSICSGLVHNFSQACGVRFLLGMFEAGAMPGMTYYLSRWYRRSELAFRIAMYQVMAPIAGAVGGLLASAILRLDSVGSITSWRMIFVIEGVITAGLGIIAFFTLTDRPSTARWLTQEEKDMAIARIKAERVGTTNELDTMNKTKLVRGIINPITLSTSFIFLLVNITVQGIALFLPTIIGTIYPDDTIIKQQLWTVPPYAVGAFFVVAFSYVSWKTDRRQIFILLGAPLVMAGYAMFLGSTDPKVRYGAAFLITSSAFTWGPMTNAQVSANVVSDTARSSAIATNVMLGNVGGLIATWSFLPSDAPNYYTGNGLNLATSSVILITCVIVLIWMKYDNAKRSRRSVEEELAGMSQKEVEDLDWKHPGFRWFP